MTCQLGFVSLAIVLIACCEANQVVQFTKDGYDKTPVSSPENLKNSPSDSVPRSWTAEPSDSTSTESTDESCNSFVGNFSGETPDSSSPVAPNVTSTPSNQSHDGMTLSTPIPNSNKTKYSSQSSSEQIYTWRNLLQGNDQQWGRNYLPHRQYFFVSSYKRNIQDRASKLLFVGGLDHYGRELNETWIYTPWTNSWLEVTAGSRLSPVHARVLAYPVLPTVCQTFVPLINKIGDVWLFDGSTETWSPLHVSAPNSTYFAVEGTVALRHSSCPFLNCSCSESVFAYGRPQISSEKLILCQLDCLKSQDGRLSCQYRAPPYVCKEIELKVDPSSCSGETFFFHGIMSAPDHDRGIIYFFGRRLPNDFRVSNQTRFFKYDVRRGTINSQVIYHNFMMIFSNVLLWNNSLLLLFDGFYYFWAVSLENNSRHERLDIDRPDFNVQRDIASPTDVIWAMEPLLFVRFHWSTFPLHNKPYIFLYHISKSFKEYFPSFVLTMKAFPPQSSPGVLRFHSFVYDYDLHTFYVYGGRRYDGGQELMNTSAAILWTLNLPSYTWWLIKPSTTPTSYMSNCVTYSRSNVILFGGQYDDGRVGDELWIYNTKRRVWTQSLSINNSWPNSRASCSLTTFSSKATVVLYGGYSKAGIALSDVWLLRFHANSTAEWRVQSSTLKDSTKSVPLARFGHSTIVVGNELVIYGGKSNRLGDRRYIYLSDMWAFSIESKTWREINLAPRQQFIRNCKFFSVADTSTSNSFLLPYGTSKILVLESIFNKSAFGISDFFWIVDTISQKMTELKLLTTSLVPLAAGIWNGSFIYYGQYALPEKIQQGALLAIGQRCVPGSAQLRVPTGPCLPCPTGQHYVSHLTVDTCVRCPPGTTTKRSGSTLMKNCTCDMNYCAYGTCEVLETEGKDITAVCRCSFGFLGQQCNQVNFVVFVLAFGLLTVVVTVTTVLFCCGIKIVRHRRARRQTEWELEETRRVFTITPKEIELICRLDEDCPGGYGRVYKAIYRDWTVAIKQLQVVMAEWVDIRKEFLREIQFMRTVRHPNIVMFIGAGQYDDHHPFLILEFLVGGALRSLLQNSEIELARKDNHQFMLDIAEGMKYLHTLRPPRVHRDLKSANLLLSKRWQVKVADFGSARLIPRQDQANARQRYSNMSNNRREEGCESLLDEGSHLTNRRIGTPRWRSPEMWKMKPYGTATDVYSFGIVVWEIVTRQTPFTGPAYRFDAKVEDAVLSGTRPTIPDNTPQHLRCLIQQCWQENAKSRPTFSDILLQLQSMVDTLQQPDIHDDLAPCHNLPAEASIELMGLPCRDAVGTCNIQGELTEMVELYNRQHKDGDVTTTTVW